MATIMTVRGIHNSDERHLPDGWSIEEHGGGLALCSPGVGAHELGYPDDSDTVVEITSDYIAITHPGEERVVIE